MTDPVFKQKGHRYHVEFQNKVIAHATVNDKLNFTQSIFVVPKYRGQGLGTELVRFIAKSRGKQLNSAPRGSKNAQANKLSLRLGSEIGPEVVLK